MKIQLDKLKAGTILDGKVTSIDGAVLFPNRTVFTKDVLRKLKAEKIQTVDFFPLKEKTKITDNEKREEEFLEKIVDGFHYGGITKEVVKNSIASFRNITFNLLNGNDSIDFNSCKHSIYAIYEQIKSNPSALINLLDIKNHSDRKSVV